MSYLHDLAERIRRNEPIPLPIGAFLHAASLVQRLGIGARLLRRPIQVPAHVISFGNLTAGGTGKTPAVIERAQRERDAGRQVAILTRGYGAGPSRFPLVMNTSAPPPDMIAGFGDEAALVAARVPGIWIVRSPDRVSGAREAIARGCNTLILDDGYQAVRLQRDENILLIDATNPFGNGYVIPRGILREPVRALSRATEILVTRCDQAPASIPEIERTIRAFSRTVPIRYSVHHPTHLRRLCDGSEHPLSLLSGLHIRAVCGIGNPESFVATLKSAGADTVELHAFPDHSVLPAASFQGGMMNILTEKDAARLGECSFPDVYALCISLAPYPFISSESTSK